MALSTLSAPAEPVLAEQPATDFVPGLQLYRLRLVLSTISFMPEPKEPAIVGLMMNGTSPED